MLGHRQNSRGTYGTEQDPHNCSFFLRIGACRHGDNCPKKHTWPAFSSVVLFEHLWIAPKRVLARKKEKENHYENFVEDMMEECLKYGQVEDIRTFGNMGDHMIGNTFVRFADEDQAARCIAGVKDRYYAGRKVQVRYSPVTDFDNAKCRDFELNSCKRGQFCNFAHFMEQPRWLRKLLRNQARQKSRSSNSSSRKKHDDWPRFPVGGPREERIAVIQQWNDRREKEGKPFKTFDAPKSTNPSSLQLFKPGRH